MQKWVTIVHHTCLFIGTNAILRVQGWCTTMVYKLQKNTYNTAQTVDIASVL